MLGRCWYFICIVYQQPGTDWTSFLGLFYSQHSREEGSGGGLQSTSLPEGRCLPRPTRWKLQLWLSFKGHRTSVWNWITTTIWNPIIQWFFIPRSEKNQSLQQGASWTGVSDIHRQWDLAVQSAAARWFWRFPFTSTCWWFCWISLQPGLRACPYPQPWTSPNEALPQSEWAL